jgi:hypothetical protein
MNDRRRRLASSAALGFVLLVAGCATVPDNAVEEVLDESTGTSLTRLVQPIELLTVAPRGPNADPFAYLAPFETNRMGRRQAYLWLAVPDERGAASEPSLSVADRAITLGAPRSERDAGLASWPYERPAPWSRIFVHELEAGMLRALATGGEWRLLLRGPNGTETFAGTPRPPTLLTDFIARVGAADD